MIRSRRLNTSQNGESVLFSKSRSRNPDSRSILARTTSSNGDVNGTTAGGFIPYPNEGIGFTARTNAAKPRKGKDEKSAGLEDGTEHTLEEVGQNFAVTRERIRQIEAKALRKLRHPSRSRRLRAFLADVQTDRENVGLLEGDGKQARRE